MFGSLNDLLAQGSFWAFVVVFGAGIATSLTPCVYPMIPITVGLFGATQTKSKTMAFFLATAYVMGIAAMYTTLGLLAALSGIAAGSILSNPWFVVALCIFFFAMATSMFGLWEFRLPSWLQNRLNTVGGKGLWGAFGMGLVGGIVIAPCTGPVLAGLLTYVATTQNLFLGGGLLFTYAIGIGVFFWVIATFSVALPKSGPWMEAIKTIFGIVLLAAALYYLANVFTPLARFTSGNWDFAVMNLVFLVLGVAVGGIHLSFRGARLLTVTRKIVGILLLCVGIFGLSNFALAPKTHLPWIYAEKEALITAQKLNRPVLIDFWAIWCAPCKKMEANVLSDPAIRRELSRFVLLKLDISEDNDQDRLLKDKYKAKELPQLIFLAPSGRELARTGNVDSPNEMLRLLKNIR
ncbi:MAG: cytochrome c biogenesis protein CcdA [Pseudomonadota bacterium]